MRRAEIPAADRPDSVDLQLAPDNRDSSRSWLGVIQVFLVALAAASATWMFGFATALYVAPPSIPMPADAPEGFELFEEAWRWVDLEYFGEPPLPQARASHAVSGLIEALDDPYAAYVARDQLVEGAAAFEPVSVEGIGAWLEMVSDGALVISTLPDSPSRRAGLEPGDLIVSADEEPLFGLALEAALALLDGPAGTSAKLVVLRQREQAQLVELVRDRIPMPGISVSRTPNDVLYLSIQSFSPETLEALDLALSEAAGMSNGLLLDLRDNPGGALRLVPDFIGRFVQDGVAYVEVREEGETKAYLALPRVEGTEGNTGAVDSPAMPERILILVNEGTASAAEVLAAALQEQAGAKLVGRKTFGKGSIQGVVRLSDDSLLRLTVARWRTPAGDSIDGIGLEPDLLVELVGDPAANDETTSAAKDPILNAALEALDSGALWRADGA